MKKYFAIIITVALVEGLVAAPLDVTVTGKSQDKVDIERVVPDPDVELKDVVPFSRLGQTDWILSEELGYVSDQGQVALMDVRSPKTFRPSMIEFPKPPFFIQSYPPPPEPIIVDRSPDAPPLPGENEKWIFLVVDQNNNLLKKIEGNTVPTDPISWDGMNRGEFVLKTDEVYSSMLQIQESPEVTRTIIGDPILLPALKYVKGNNVIYEFSNDRVYEEGAPIFSPVLKVYVQQLMNDLRKFQGAPFEITLYDRNFELAQRRVKSWRAELEKNLLVPSDQFNIKVARPSNRGEITQVVLSITE